MKATQSKPSDPDALRKAELIYRRAFAKSCNAHERFESAKREQIAAGEEVRRLRLELDGPKA